MPIRINLLAESQAAEDQRRRDPVKRAIWIGAFLVALVGIWCGKLQVDIWHENTVRGRLEKDWAAKEPKYKTLVAVQEKMQRLERLQGGLERYSTNRFLWANVLNAIQHSTIDDIQVTRIRGEQSYDIVNGVATTNALVTPPEIKRKPGSSTEKIRLVVDARDFNNQNQTWTKYKEALAKNDYFKRTLKKGEGFVLDGTQGMPSRDPSDPIHEFVTFSLATHLPEVKRYE